MASMQNTLDQPQIIESLVSCSNSQGQDLQATLLKLTRFQATFEVYGPPDTLRLSEALTDLRILVQSELVYAGRAVVSNLMNMSSVTVCEATLDETCLDLDALCQMGEPQKLLAGFEKFLEEWGRNYRIDPEFKVVMADMQSMFLDLRLWMEQLELSVRSQPGGDRTRFEREILQVLQQPVMPAAAAVVEKFETVANRLEPASQPAHRTYMKRQIHPLVLCSPFLYRTFKKPLGYAGDYEMVNMMLRDPFEGGSMFAKMINRIFLNTPPVLAHQNRIAYLTRRLADETARVAARGGVLRVYNLGCGPAKEIQDFISEEMLADRAQFTLLDFNEETLAYTAKTLGEIKQKRQRTTTVQMVRKSVHQLLKEANRAGTRAKYDLVYCAGLFDYLSDAVCKRLMNLLYDLTAPGGLLITTNVSTANPSRNWMEYVLDWHLLHRGATEFARLAPELAPAESCSVQAISAGVNIALEVRKPDHAN